MKYPAQVCLILLFAFLAGTGWVQAQSPAEKKSIKNAERFSSFGQYEEALAAAKDAVSRNSENPWSLYLLGKSMILTGNKAGADEILQKAWNLNPDIALDLDFFLAKALHFNSRYEEAEIAYSRAQTKFKPESPESKKISLGIQQCQFAQKISASGSSKSPNYQIENLGPGLNSPFSEHSPVISTDGKTLVFTSRRPAQGRDSLAVDEDIFISLWKEGAWTQPENPGKPLNTQDQDASVGISSDGQTLFLYRNPPGNGDIFVSRLKGKDWTQPEALPSPINSPYFESCISLSADGKTAWFASDRPGGLGGMDIWKVELVSEGKWGTPLNPGEPLNSAFDEDAPFLHPNGVDFWFSSDRPQSFGGYDIFKSQIEQGKFSPPENLGLPLNTPDDDVYFVVAANGKTGFLASNRPGGFGNKDLYQVDLVEKPQEKEQPENHPPDSIIPVKIKAEKSKPTNPLTLYKGLCLDALSRKPVDAGIRVMNQQTGQEVGRYRSNLNSGTFTLTLPSGAQYSIIIEAEDYQPFTEILFIPAEQDYQELNKEFNLNKIKVGESIILKDIHFSTGSASLSPESKAELDRLFKFLQEVPGSTVEISGHTDNVGDPNANLELSKARAEAVVSYLINMGIPAERLIASGFGSGMPIDDNNSEEGRARNRRTEFKILKN